MGKSSNNKKASFDIASKEIQKKLDIANKKFEVMNRKEEEVDAQIVRLHEKKAQIKFEKARLQGEHRILTELMGDNPDEDPEELSAKNEKDGNNV